MVLIDNRIGFVKHIVKFRDREYNCYRTADYEKLTSQLSERGITYTVESPTISEDLLSLEGVEVKSWDEAVSRINGEYSEPVDRLELIENAVLELAGIVGGN